MNTITDQQCSNPSCPANPGTAPIIIHSQKNKRFKCKACNVTWVAHKNAIHYGLRSKIPSIQRGIELLKHGLSIRKAAEYVQVSPSTIQRWKGRVKNKDDP